MAVDATMAKDVAADEGVGAEVAVDAMTAMAAAGAVAPGIGTGVLITHNSGVVIDSYGRGIVLKVTTYFLSTPRPPPQFPPLRHIMMTVNMMMSQSFIAIAPKIG